MAYQSLFSGEHKRKERKDNIIKLSFAEFAQKKSGKVKISYAIAQSDQNLRRAHFEFLHADNEDRAG